MQIKTIHVIEKHQWQYKLKATLAHLPVTLKKYSLVCCCLLEELSRY